MKNKNPMMMVTMMVIVIASIIFAVIGYAMHQQVATEEAAFHELQNSYYSQSKAVRDGAETGSELNKDLVQIQQYPSELLRLKLVGVGRTLTGIFIVLLGILIALMTMPIKLGKVIKNQN
jgi:uncharacterized membrane protein YidH (DUF202 family)